MCVGEIRYAICMCAQFNLIDISSRYTYHHGHVFSVNLRNRAAAKRDGVSVFANSAGISHDSRLWHIIWNRDGIHTLLSAHIETSVNYWATTAASALLAALKCCPDDLTGNSKTSSSNDFLRPGRSDRRQRREKRTRSTTSKARRCVFIT